MPHSQNDAHHARAPRVDAADGRKFEAPCSAGSGAPGLPTISVGSVGLSSEFIGTFRGEGSSVGKLDETIARLERGEFDLVAVGRALLQDREWALKVKPGRHDELRDYDAKALQTYF